MKLAAAEAVKAELLIFGAAGKVAKTWHVFCKIEMGALAASRRGNTVCVHGLAMVSFSVRIEYCVAYA
jgi:urocanate hydratase